MNNIRLPKTLRGFFYFFIKKNPVAFLVFFLAPSSIILETNVMPYGLKMLIDQISATTHTISNEGFHKQALPAIFLIIGSWVLKTAITRCSSYWECYIIPKFESDIRMSVFKHVVGRSYGFFIDNMVGNISGKIDDLPEATNRIRQVISWNILSASLVVITSCFMLLSVHYTFAVIIVVWCVCHMLLVLMRSKYIDKISAKHAENQALLSGAITDEINNIVSLKSHIYDFPKYSFTNKYCNNELNSNKKLHKTIIHFEMLLDIPVIIMLSLILYYLIKSWEQKLITPGDFVLIFNLVLASMYTMVALGHVLIDIFKDTGRVRQSLSLLVDDKNNQYIKKNLKITNGEILFKDVNFSYLNSNIFSSNQNILIEGGSTIGIVGYSGSGKSSFIKLILRLNEVQSGEIKIDNQNINKVSEQSLMQNISYISQETALFHTSILENIKIGNQKATYEQIIEAAKNACCHDFISKMPDGYETIVGSKGNKLSGGQKQLIMIARALIKSSPILVLDEATSSLDSITELAVINSIQGLCSYKTVIIIAHRLSSISFCEKILFFENGNIIEAGTHDQLIEKGEQYCRMWNVQKTSFI